MLRLCRRHAPANVNESKGLAAAVLRCYVSGSYITLAVLLVSVIIEKRIINNPYNSISL
jgi:hypothetical protein